MKIIFPVKIRAVYNIHNFIIGFDISIQFAKYMITPTPYTVYINEPMLYFKNNLIKSN